MYVTYRVAALVAFAVALVAGWSAYRSSASEIAVLRAFDGEGQDLFATLWIVDDDHGFAWIRAARPDRRWLSVIAREPNVRVRRDGLTRSYVARIFDTDAARTMVGGKFREKYGLADHWRAWTTGSDTVPIRLERP